MRVTGVKVLPVNGEDKLKAYVTVTLDNCFVIRDVKVISGHSGNFIAMPSKKMKDGSYKDLIHPANKSTRDMIEGLIMEEYDRVQKNMNKQASA